MEIPLSLAGIKIKNNNINTKTDLFTHLIHSLVLVWSILLLLTAVKIHKNIITTKNGSVTGG